MRGARLLFTASQLAALAALAAALGGRALPWVGALIGVAFALWLAGAGLDTLARAAVDADSPLVSAWSPPWLQQGGRLTPDVLLLRYPHATLRWLRGRLGQSREAFAAHVGASRETVVGWEALGRAISPAHQRRIVPVLARQLATEEGAAFVRSLGRGEAPG